MRRVLLVAVVLLGGAAFSAEGASAKAQVKRHRWRCHFVGRMVFCDLPDKPLQARLARDGITLHERTAWRFDALVKPPPSFRD